MYSVTVVKDRVSQQTFEMRIDAFPSVGITIGQDFIFNPVNIQGRQQILDIGPGENELAVSFSVVNDDLVEGTETFELFISVAKDALEFDCSTSTGCNASTLVLIEDDDGEL